MVILKSREEVEKMHRAGQIVAKTLNVLSEHIQPGITTMELDAIAEGEIRKAGAIPSFKGYRGFPASLCVSVNEEVVHGIPSHKKLKEGDVVSLDLGAIWQGFHGDAARTVTVGKAADQAMQLMRVTEQSLMLGIRGKARASKWEWYWPLSLWFAWAGRK